jgi:ribosomal protein S6
LKTYDALFIFPNTLKDEAVAALLKDIENEVTKLQGKVTETQRLGVRSFPRPLKKMEAGSYVRMLVQLEPKNVSPLQARFKLNENIFRVQVVAAMAKKPAAAPAAAKEEVRPDGKS